jgi:hypothetical protein
MSLGRGHMSAKSDLDWSIGNRRSGSDRLLHAFLRSGNVATAARIASPITDGDFREGEDLIVVWRDDELLNAVGRMSQDVNGVPVPFDGSADRELVELLLAWRVSAEPFRDGTGAMIWTLDRRGSAEETHGVRGDGERVDSRAPWTGCASPRTIPRRLLLPGHLEIERLGPRRACSTNNRRNGQIVKLTRERERGR